MKTNKTIAAVMKRLERAAALARTEKGFARLIERRGGRIGLRGTSITFTRTEIKQLARTIEVRAKIAKSDVPDNMLALLTALRASTGPIPS